MTKTQEATIRAIATINPEAARLAREAIEQATAPKAKVWALCRVTGHGTFEILTTGNHNQLEAMSRQINKDAGTRVAFVTDATAWIDQEAEGEDEADEADEAAS